MAWKRAIQLDSGRPQRDTKPARNPVRNALIALVVAIIGVGAFLVLCPQAREPVYEGKLLSDNDCHCRVIGALGLGRLGTNAQQAVLALPLRLNDRECVVRYDVTNALKAIDPEAAIRAGVQ